MRTDAVNLARMGAQRVQGEAPPRDLGRPKLFVWGIDVVADGEVNN